jgi:hypothetical protein
MQQKMVQNVSIIIYLLKNISAPKNHLKSKNEKWQNLTKNTAAAF